MSERKRASLSLVLFQLEEFPTQEIPVTSLVWLAVKPASRVTFVR